MERKMWPSLSQGEELEHVRGVAPSCLSFKASSEMVAALTRVVSSDGGAPARGSSKRRRLAGVTISFGTKGTGSLTVGEGFSTSFEIAFGREGDASVTECVSVARAEPTKVCCAGIVVGKLQLGRSGNDQKAAFAAVSGAYRASAAQKSKTKQLSAPTSAVFATPVDGFVVPSGGAGAALTSDAQLKKCSAEYREGRKHFARINSELKGVKRTIERLGEQWAAETGAAKEATSKEIRRMYRETEEAYAQRHAYLKRLQAYLATLRGTIIAYRDGRAGAGSTDTESI